MTDIINAAANSNIANVSKGSWSTLFCGPVALWVFVIVTIGAILLLLSFLPGWWNTIRTKDTSSMSLTMWIISVAGLFFLTLFYLLGVISSTSGGKDVSVQFLIVLLCEGISLLLSIHVLVLKLIYMSKAKKMGISEKEYCALLKTKKNKEVKAH